MRRFCNVLCCFGLCWIWAAAEASHWPAAASCCSSALCVWSHFQTLQATTTTTTTEALELTSYIATMENWQTLDLILFSWGLMGVGWVSSDWRRSVIDRRAYAHHFSPPSVAVIKKPKCTTFPPQWALLTWDWYYLGDVIQELSPNICLVQANSHGIKGPRLTSSTKSEKSSVDAVETSRSLCFTRRSSLCSLRVVHLLIFLVGP